MADLQLYGELLWAESVHDEADSVHAMMHTWREGEDGATTGRLLEIFIDKEHAKDPLIDETCKAYNYLITLSDNESGSLGEASLHDHLEDVSMEYFIKRVEISGV